MIRFGCSFLLCFVKLFLGNVKRHLRWAWVLEGELVGRVIDSILALALWFSALDKRMDVLIRFYKQPDRLVAPVCR